MVDKTEDIEYKIANKNDIPRVVTMRIGYIECDQGEISASNMEKMRVQMPAYFEKHLNKDIIVFTARSSGKIVSVAMLLIIEKPANPNFINGRVGEVLSVYTLEEFQHRGIATVLMNQLVQYSRENKIDRIDLAATDDGYGVYKKIGFKDKTNEYKEMRYVISN